MNIYIKSLVSSILLISSILTVAMYSGAEETIKIGVLTPLSAPGDAAGGEGIVRAALFAPEYIDKGGVDLFKFSLLRGFGDFLLPAFGYAGR